MTRGFIKKEVAEILGIRPSHVQYYTDQGIIVPEIDPAVGRGTRRRYSWRNLMQILVVKRIVEYGIPLSEVKIIIKRIEDWSPNILNQIYLCIHYRNLKVERVQILPADDEIKIKLTELTTSINIINITDIANMAFAR